MPDLTQFRVPALRHMAWICHAPQLFADSLTLDLSGYLRHHRRVAETLALLRHWDHNPGQGPGLLSEVPHPRLGLYFERLYECLMTEVLGWELLVKNLPVRGSRKTLGELDFVLRNPHTGGIEHHEIAVKFYLGHQKSGHESALWYGPNASDRLDIKTRRLLEHQSQITRLPEAAAALKAAGIHEVPRSCIFMPGYLFYPPEPGFPSPPGAPADHHRGHWLYLEQALAMNPETWVPLRKPHWLGPWIQPDAPDTEETLATLERVHTTNSPRLFARMAREAVGPTGHPQPQWKEVERFFVVPAQWPERH
ncbi:MAG: DUF1853 family protein [Oleiphilaceae bacterium]|nr:DUF1853 family protein [Oleiphilaceae bacterium]